MGLHGQAGAVIFLDHCVYYLVRFCHQQTYILPSGHVELSIVLHACATPAAHEEEGPAIDRVRFTPAINNPTLPIPDLR